MINLLFSFNNNNKMKKMKLTKSALNKFIGWTTTKYNDWLGYGTKKQNIDFAFNVLSEGKEVHEIQCASPAGENPQRGRRKSWRTKQSGCKYIINGPEKSVTNVYSKEVLQFS